MFKGKYISNKNTYYISRVILFLFSLLFLGLILSITGIFNLDHWTIFLVVVIPIIYLNYKRQNDIQKLDLIEISSDQLIIKTRNNQLVEEINLNTVQEIETSKKYSVEEDNFEDLFKSINFIKLISDDQTKTLNFRVESFFMREQLRKLKEVWKSRGQLV